MCETLIFKLSNGSLTIILIVFIIYSSHENNYYMMCENDYFLNVGFFARVKLEDCSLFVVLHLSSSFFWVFLFFFFFLLPRFCSLEAGHDQSFKSKYFLIGRSLIWG